ncbi:hypothetical protein AS029_14495 [Microbacterium enclense]|nr:hypothetical protein AS029_14495 [Microbacterium enclense]
MLLLPAIAVIVAVEPGAAHVSFRFTVVVATPAESDVAVGGEKVALAGPANVTACPATGDPSLSTTIALTGAPPAAGS